MASKPVPKLNSEFNPLKHRSNQARKDSIKCNRAEKKKVTVKLLNVVAEVYVIAQSGSSSACLYTKPFMFVAF